MRGVTQILVVLGNMLKQDSSFSASFQQLSLETDLRYFLQGKQQLINLTRSRPVYTKCNLNDEAITECPSGRQGINKQTDGIIPHSFLLTSENLQNKGKFCFLPRTMQPFY